MRLRTASVPVLALVAAIAAVGGAVAASLVVTTNTLGAGSATTSCDTTGVSVVETRNATTVTSLTISNIDSPCIGGNLYATIYNGTNPVVSMGPTAITGTLTVTFSGLSLSAKDIHYTNVMVQGP